MILIPLAFGLARKTKKSTLYYVIPLLAGLATGFAFIPPSAGSVLVANMLNVDLGVMIAVGVPVGILSLIFAGIFVVKIYLAAVLIQDFRLIFRRSNRKMKRIFPHFLLCCVLSLFR